MARGAFGFGREHLSATMVGVFFHSGFQLVQLIPVVFSRENPAGENLAEGTGSGTQ